MIEISFALILLALIAIVVLMFSAALVATIVTFIVAVLTLLLGLLITFSPIIIVAGILYFIFKLFRKIKNKFSK
jgi:hypothetical protein